MCLGIEEIDYFSRSRAASFFITTEEAEKQAPGGKAGGWALGRCLISKNSGWTTTWPGTVRKQEGGIKGSLPLLPMFECWVSSRGKTSLTPSQEEKWHMCACSLQQSEIGQDQLRVLERSSVN